MISLIQSLPIGNALRVHLQRIAGATRWKLLRKIADTFTGHDDGAATVVLDTTDDLVVLDRSGLANGTTYYYKPYALIGSDWVGYTSVGAIPVASLEDASSDVLSLVRERLEMGMQAEISAGRLTHPYNRMPVFTAPPLYEETKWPVITVHLQDDGPGEFGIGMDIVPDEFDGNDWTEYEGYLSSVQLTVVGWSLNPDERIAIRKAIKRVILGNMPIFDDAGMINVDPRLSDVDDFQSYSAPVYQCMCNLSCLAPSAVRSSVADIAEINVQAESI